MLSDEYIRKLENEVRDISFKLKYASTFNNVELLKFLKKSLITVKYFIPYIVTSSLTFGLFSILGYTPFILDKREEYSYTLYEFDNSGNYSENNVITTDIVDNNIYVYNYDSNLLSLDKYIANYSFDEIVNLVNNNNEEIINKCDYLGTINCIYNDGYDNLVKAFVYEKDLSYLNYINEDFITNLLSTVGWSGLILFLSILIKVYQDSYYGFNYLFDNYKFIDDNYKLIDVDDLNKKLLIKKQNLQRFGDDLNE